LPILRGNVEERTVIALSKWNTPRLPQRLIGFCARKCRRFDEWTLQSDESGDFQCRGILDELSSNGSSPKLISSSKVLPGTLDSLVRLGIDKWSAARFLSNISRHALQQIDFIERIDTPDILHNDIPSVLFDCSKSDSLNWSASVDTGLKGGTCRKF
jgi:hypothetical protein